MRALTACCLALALALATAVALVHASSAGARERVAIGGELDPGGLA